MKKEIVGIVDVQYKNKNGVQCQGVRLYCTETLTEGGIGKKTYDVYIADMKSADFKLGEFQFVQYEPYGNGKYFRAVGIIY